MTLTGILLCLPLGAILCVMLALVEAALVHHAAGRVEPQ